MVASACASGVFDLLGGGFVDVGVLVGAVVDACEESALFFDFEEQLPCFVGERDCEGLHIVGTAGRVNYLVKVAFFLKEELLVTCDSFRECVGILIRNIERSSRDRVDSCKRGRHRFGL